MPLEVPVARPHATLHFLRELLRGQAISLSVRLVTLALAAALAFDRLTSVVNRVSSLMRIECMGAPEVKVQDMHFYFY